MEKYRTFLLRGKSVLFVRRSGSTINTSGLELVARGMNRHFTTWCVTLNLRDLDVSIQHKRGKGGQIYPIRTLGKRELKKIEQLMKDMENGILRGRLDKIGLRTAKTREQT